MQQAENNNYLRRSVFTFVLLCLLSVHSNILAQEDSLAVSQNVAVEDSVDVNAPDFVKVSLLIASPGEVLYSLTGHACLRMECPVYDLDYCYSYESENVKEKVLTFLAGKLKMGMFSIPTKEFLSEYKKDERGLYQYELNLPIAVKRNLWQKLDEAVEEGADLPYDYAKRGCAKATLDFLLSALDTVQVEYAPWPERYKLLVLASSMCHSHDSFMPGGTAYVCLSPSLSRNLNRWEQQTLSLLAHTLVTMARISI